ncbi:Leucyl aminopeptidase yscIV [Dipsacomyces acuminosporus]|nr:Leucyl aminopeptidase yscIV [Dipsacomyces acuminosporus]
MAISNIDCSSQANLSDATTKHVHLSLSVDFKRSILAGSVTITGQALEDDVEAFVVDTNHLGIKAASIENNGEFVAAGYELGEAHPVYGSALRIPLSNIKKGDELRVKIEYETTTEGAAIQFLTPEQTLGKTHPYLFTQCQAIHARSLLPCQDSPSVKISYSADIRVPKPLTALMSAISTGSRDEGDSTVFSFEQKTTIPSYLIALVVGNLAMARISDRCAVWSEHENIDDCAWEFAEVDKILQTAEKLVTPYSWGRYDLLVLPPSFPYGGMENPCLTFVTPTLLAGDRSLTDVIAHEIAHSWSGNLVTTKNWEHFWLNEGWTTFLERKIVALLNGEGARQLSLALGYKSLNDDVELHGSGNQLTSLVPKLDGVDPDDAYSRVPYEKGSLLLYHLEQLLGPVVWSHITKMYISEFSGRSIGTDDFYAFLKRYVHHYLDENAEKKFDSVDWDAWFSKPGMPPVSFQFDDKPQRVCTDLAEKWWSARSHDGAQVEFPAGAFNELSTAQKVIFLNALGSKEEIPHSMLARLDRAYALSSSGNSEVKMAWLSLALKNAYEAAFDSTVKMLGEQGRMKYTRPLYRALAKTGPAGKALAEQTFAGLRGFYHPICSRLVAKDLGL